jgi:hypothetical protein
MVNYAHELVKAVSVATHAAHNEAQLRHEVENGLEVACGGLGIPWTPFQLDRTLKSNGNNAKYVDVAHGAVIIEYERPRSFVRDHSSVLLHARQQAEEYAGLMSREEGRPVSDYVLVVWDGASISFGTMSGSSGTWDTVQPFDDLAAQRLLDHLVNNEPLSYIPNYLRVL